MEQNFAAPVIREPGLSFREPLTKRSKTARIVLHHAAASGCSVADIHRWHLARGWSGIGYHYYVRQDGSIDRGRPEDVIGAHAYGANRDSVGICFEGNFENETMSAVQQTAGAALLAQLFRTYSLTADAVCGHNAVCATACPGKHFPMAALLAQAAGEAPPAAETKNFVLSFQTAALADGFSLPQYGADGLWGSETAEVAARCVVKQRATPLYRHATALVQRLLGVDSDGICGPITDGAIRQFQAAQGLAVDGAVGRATWPRLLGVTK